MSDSDDNANHLDNDEIENGHVPMDFQLDQFEDGHAGETSGQFDLDLPTSHRYLGKLDNVSGYTFYDNGEIITLVAIQTNTLVFPGFTLPLVLNNDVEIDMLRRYTSKKNAFVLLTPDNTFKNVFRYGVIMEIFETHLRHGVLYLKARSRQRCRLLPSKEIKILSSELFQVTVEALLEPPTTSPLCATELNSLKMRRKLKCDRYSDMLKNYKYRRYHLGQFPVASWVFDKYEVCFLVHKLVEELRRYFLTEFIPEDPVQLSYWFVQNFQLQHEERLKIMALNTTVQRLKLELKFMNLQRLICCIGCWAELAQQSYVFPMSKDGVQSNYCNPSGSVYETVTVSKATNIKLVGLTSAQFSWFPGYSWTVMHCKVCNAHLGWKFTSVTLKPDSFFGLAKNCFRIKILNEEDLEEK